MERRTLRQEINGELRREGLAEQEAPSGQPDKAAAAEAARQGVQDQDFTAIGQAGDGDQSDPTIPAAPAPADLEGSVPQGVVAAPAGPIPTPSDLLTEGIAGTPAPGAGAGSASSGLLDPSNPATTGGSRTDIANLKEGATIVGQSTTALPNGSFTETTLSNGTVIWTHHEITETGQVVRETISNAEYKMSMEETTVYDNSNNVVSTTVTQKTPTGTVTETTTKNADGTTTTTRRETDQDGNSRVTVTTRDAQGNVVSRTETEETAEDQPDDDPPDDEQPDDEQATEDPPPDDSDPEYSTGPDDAGDPGPDTGSTRAMDDTMALHRQLVQDANAQAEINPTPEWLENVFGGEHGNPWTDSLTDPPDGEPAVAPAIDPAAGHDAGDPGTIDYGPDHLEEPPDPGLDPRLFEDHSASPGASDEKEAFASAAPAEGADAAGADAAADLALEGLDLDARPAWVREVQPLEPPPADDAGTDGRDPSDVGGSDDLRAMYFKLALQESLNDEETRQRLEEEAKSVRSGDEASSSDDSGGNESQAPPPIPSLVSPSDTDVRQVPPELTSPPAWAEPPDLSQASAEYDSALDTEGDDSVDD
jgi:hypothetical protein